MTQEVLDFVGDNFGNIIALILVVVVLIVAIKISITLDWNKYSERRKETNLSKARSYCPHIGITLLDDGRIRYESWFFSPSGTPNWVCEKCGSMRFRMDDEMLEKQASYYTNNIKQYKKTLQKYDKYRKKSL